MKICLKIEYDGTDFQGWQIQPGRPTIQGTLEAAAEKITGRRVNIYGAGRTDSGVHARGQVAHFMTDSPIPVEKWAMVLNTNLPNSIRILKSVEVPDAFHASRDAKSKIYEYRLINGRIPTALDKAVYFYPRPLDWDEIKRALPYFVGRKDFKSFQAAGSNVLTTEREVMRFDLGLEDSNMGLFRFAIEGSGFLKQMVRAIIGTLLEIGEGKIKLSDLEDIIASKRRESAGRTAPASGLCLLRVNYENLNF